MWHLGKGAQKGYELTASFLKPTQHLLNHHSGPRCLRWHLLDRQHSLLLILGKL